VQVVVSDSGDFASIGKYKPQDATTNPSLILAATKKAEYAPLLDAAVAKAKSEGGSLDQQVDSALDHLLVQFGKKILEIIPGKVSTEVDAVFSFSTQASVDKALRIIEVSQEMIGAFQHHEPSANQPISSTRRRVSLGTASSSRSPRPGRASRLPRFFSATTMSTAT
jgi:transaldolase